MGFGLVEDGCLIKYNFPEQDVFIDDDVKEIGRMVFWGADLMTVRIPPTVTAIRCRAFYSCKRMKSVVIPDTVTLIEEEAFGYGYDGKMEDFSILGMKGTEAEWYAKENGFTFYEVINFGFSDRKRHIEKISFKPSARCHSLRSESDRRRRVP